MSVFHFGKSATMSVFIRFPSAFLFACATTNRGIQRQRHKTNTSSYSVPSKIKQLFIFQRYKHTRNKLPSFRSFKNYNSLDQLGKKKPKQNRSQQSNQKNLSDASSKRNNHNLLEPLKSQQLKPGEFVRMLPADPAPLSRKPSLSLLMQWQKQSSGIVDSIATTSTYPCSSSDIELKLIRLRRLVRNEANRETKLLRHCQLRKQFQLIILTILII